MAKQIDPSHLKGLLECGICLEEFQDPRSLPCVHSFCLKCLDSHVSSSKTTEGTFQCPQCRLECTAPGGDVGNFPKNFFANNLKDILPMNVLQELPSMSTEYLDVLNCERHKRVKINWYCYTCTLPLCSECVLKNHKSHDTQELDTVAQDIKQDLKRISPIHAKRLETLQQIFADLNASEAKMEREFDKASGDIKVSAENMARLISRHEELLQRKLNKARKTARTQMAKAKAELENIIKDASTLMSSMESSTERDVPLLTVLQAPNIEKRFRGQEDISVPSADCTVARNDVKLRALLPVANYVGSITTSTTAKKELHFETVHLKNHIKTIDLDSTCDFAVCGIAPILNTLICVAFSGQPYIWMYINNGKLGRKLMCPSIKSISGLVALDSKKGNVALVDGDAKKVKFVTFSEQMKIKQHSCTNVPIAPDNISFGQNQQITVSDGDTIATLLPNGQILSIVQMSMLHSQLEFCIVDAAQTKSGFVISDQEKQKVYFTDAKGHIRHTSTDFARPGCAVQTSWGHVLVVDADEDEIKVFSECGEFLGNVCDDARPTTDLHHMHIDEDNGLLYVAVGKGEFGGYELRTYKFDASDLPSLPLQRSVTKLSVHVKLVKV